MTDITPANGFADAFAEAEAAALATDAPAEADTATDTPQETTSERARNELGQFAPAEAEAAPEPTEAAETPAETLLAGKYKNVDELERAYKEIASLSGRQGAELAELRSAFDERFEQLDQRLSQTPAAAPVQITGDLIDTNPAYAAQLAYEQDNGAAFAAAFERWQEDQPAQAAAWAAAKHTEDQVRTATAALEQKLADFETRFAPAAQQAQQQAAAAELAKVATDFPELQKLLDDGKIAEIADQYPDQIGQALISANPAQQAKALRAAAEIARGRASETLRATAQEVARQTADEARAAAEDAHVVSSANATSTATEHVTPEQEIANSVTARIKARQDGWNDAWVRNG